MQTISIPYSCDRAAARFIAEARRVYSAAVRTAYANGMDAEGRLAPEKDLRNLVKSRFAGGVVDAWILHCATLEGREARKRVPEGAMVFGGRKHLERRNDKLIDNAGWRRIRLLPMASRGDNTKYGNRHFKLSPDGRACTLRMLSGRLPATTAEGKPKLNKKGNPVRTPVWQTHVLHLAHMAGNAGEILRQAAALAAEKRINLMFRIDETHLHVTVDPMDLPDHPERRRPVQALPGRMVGVDLNPGSIGVSAVFNTANPGEIGETRLLEYFLAEPDLPKDASTEQVRETLAAVAGRIVGLARKHRCGTVVLEKGLGKLRSGGKNRSLNRLINYWARTVFLHLLTRKARLAGIRVMEVWGGYSTTIGNLAFEAPDACASAAEIGRRGIALASGSKDVLPAMLPAVRVRQWKDVPVPVTGSPRQAASWGELHRTIKAAKIGYRRPHPALPGPDDRGGASLLGHAVRRLGCRNRPGRIYALLHGPGTTATEPGSRWGNGPTRKSG